MTASPEARDGFLDLSQASLSSVVRLDGAWEFHWASFLSPSEPSPADRVFLPIPGAWTGHTISRMKLPAQGYATYRLRIRFPAGTDKVAFRVPIMGTSYRLYFGQELIAANGNPAKTKEETIPDFHPLVTSAVAVSPTLEGVLTLHIANFHDRSGGPWLPLAVGTESAARADREQILARDLLLFGALLIMGLYHIGLYLVRRNEDLPLYFGLFSLIMALRSVTEGEKYILTAFPSLDWTAAVRLSYVTFYAAIPLFLRYFTRLFPEDSHRVLVRILTWVLLALSAAVIVTEVRVFSETLLIVHVITVMLAPYCLYINIKAIIARRPHARLFLSVLAIFGATVVHDILTGYSLTPTGVVLAPFGLFLFIFAQAYLLSVRFSRAFLHAEMLSRDLDILNSQLEERIEDRNRELSLTLKSIRRDLSTARKIQQAFLPRTDVEGLIVDSLYMPMEEVGGDIFDFMRTDQGAWRCLLADATGHGVQGALVTMALKSEFESLSLKHKEPAELLSELNKSFAEKFATTAMFASAIVLDIESGGRLRYASAGHPDQWLVGPTGRRALPRTGPVLGITREAVYRQSEIPLSSQHTVFLFSDGAFEHLHDSDDVAEEKLGEMIAGTAGVAPEARLAAIRPAILGSLESGRRDDVTMLAVSFRPPVPLEPGR